MIDIKLNQEIINEGKFGTVRLGVHKKTQRQVAIKILSKKDLEKKERGLDQVRVEVEIMKICQHPNIIKLYDVYENPESLFISIIVGYIKTNINSYGILLWR